MKSERIDGRTDPAGQVSDLPEMSAGSTGGSETRPTRPSRLWLWIVAAFALQALAWTTWLVIASHNKVEEVPVIPAQSR